MKKVWLGIIGLVLIPYLIYAATVDVRGINNNQEFNTVVIMDNQTATGSAVNTYVLPGIMSRFTWNTLYSSGATSTTVYLQGSLDNSNWYTLDTSTSAEMRHIVNKPVKYIRAYAYSFELSGSSVTASVIGMKN